MNRPVPIIAALVATAALQLAASPAHARGPDFEIDFSGAYPALPRQTRSEHIEQLRDWIRFALAARIDGGRSSIQTTAGAVFGDAIFRGPHIGEEVDQRVGAARSFVDVVGTVDTLHIVLPNAGEQPERELLAGEFDRSVRARGEPPKRVQVHRYELDLLGARARIFDEATQSTAEFEARVGNLTSAEVRGVDDLMKFLASEPDLVSAQCNAGRLTVTGRPHAADRAGVNVDELATLYSPPRAAAKALTGSDEEIAKALAALLSVAADDTAARNRVYENYPPLGTALRLKNEVERRLKEFALDQDTVVRWVIYDDAHGQPSAVPPPSLDDPEAVDETLADLIPLLLGSSSSPGLYLAHAPLGTALMYEEEARRRTRLYGAALSPEIVARWTVMESGQEQPIGFSLDPRNPIPEAVKALRTLAGSADAIRSALTEATAGTMTSVASPAVWSESHVSTAKAYLEWYANSLQSEGYWDWPLDEPPELALGRPAIEPWLKPVLWKIASASAASHSYLFARYDGPVAGTRVGMVFYYTDLIMKLWGWNYRDQSPGIAGLLPIAGTPVSESRCREGGANSGRLWLGERRESITQWDDQFTASLRFDRIVVRAFLHATDLATKRDIAKDTPFSVRRYIDWLDQHYDLVSRHERRYEELNQLMKWTALIRWLAVDRPDCFVKLRGLVRLEPKGGLRFSEWARQHHDELLFPFDRLPRAVRLVDDERELVSFVLSKPWSACHSTQQIAGGVSPSSLEDSRARVPVKNRIPGPFADTEYRPIEFDGGVPTRGERGAPGTVTRHFSARERSFNVKEFTVDRQRAAAPQALRPFETLEREGVREDSGRRVVLRQRAAGKPDGSLVIKAKGNWQGAEITGTATANEEAARAVSALERVDAAAHGRDWAGLVEKAGMRADLYIGGHGSREFAFSLPEMPEVYVEVARGPPSAEEIKDGWRTSDRGDTPGGTVKLKYRVRSDGVKGKGPPLGSYKDFVPAAEIARDADVDLVWKALDASDLDQVRRSTEKLISAPARAPPTQVSGTVDKLLEKSVRLRNAGDPASEELRQMAGRLLSAIESRPEHIAPGIKAEIEGTGQAVYLSRIEPEPPPPLVKPIDDQRVILAGPARHAELINLLGDGGDFAVDAVMAQDGLLDGRAPGRSMVAELADRFLPGAAGEFPRVEAFVAELPVLPDGKPARVRGRGQVLGDVIRSPPANNAEASPVGGVSLGSAIGTFTRTKYQPREISWTGLLTESDRTRVSAALIVSCDANGDGKVGAEEWLNCRCDADLNGKLGPEEQGCRKEAVNWIVSTRSKTPAIPEWVARRCTGTSNDDLSVMCVAALGGRATVSVAGMDHGSRP